QERAKFTVEAIYGAFVRIWRRQGWSSVSTRAVALEAGVSTGTLYEYFPNREALLSGYVRHCIEATLAALDNLPPQPWRATVRQLVLLTCGAAPDLPYFDAAMFKLEQGIAEPKHHRRAYQELSGRWRRILGACADLPRPVGEEDADALFVALWGGRRYLLMLDSPAIDSFGERMVQITIAALENG
ncbi:MAG: TetR/AcrR family transcriptional regulator, partial [Burkholderiaceae bacterium]|nr:TetR/AcrR family transcriptional regulator [Burkholderiaceae bacterium]